MTRYPAGDEWYTSRGIIRRRGVVLDGVAHLPLTKGKFALLDPIVLAEVEKYQWGFSHGYALKGSGRRRMYLHGFVMALADEAVEGCEIDHINRHPLDCRRRNLRLVTRQQNQINRNLQSNNTSGIRGVTFCKRDGRWKASMKRHGRTINIGSFSDRETAGRVREKAAAEYDRALRHSALL